MENAPWTELKPVTSDYAEVALDWGPSPEGPEGARETESSGVRGGNPQGGGPSELTKGLYSYNNLHVREQETCGQAAIATIVDFFQLNPFRLPYTVPGRDGRRHFENEAFVGAVTHQFPPTSILGVACTTPEIIQAALSAYGTRCDRQAPKDYSDGAEARDALVKWIQTKRMPVLALLDMPKLWPSGYGPYTLHWGAIYSVGSGGVAMASWHRNFGVDWATFMRSWHCEGLPGGLNYLQIRAWR